MSSRCTYVHTLVYIGIIIGVHEERHTGVHVVNRSLVHTGSVALSFIRPESFVSSVNGEQLGDKSRTSRIRIPLHSLKKLCIFSINDDVKKKKTFVSSLVREIISHLFNLYKQYNRNEIFHNFII